MDVPDPHLLSPPKQTFRSYASEGVEPVDFTIEPSSSSGIETSTYEVENDKDNANEDDNDSARSNSPSLTSSPKKYEKRKQGRFTSGMGQVAAVLRKSTKSRNVPRRRSTVTTSGSSLSYPGKMTAKDKKLLKMILVIFTSFLICYLPITVTKFVNKYQYLNISGYLLIYLTTCINPIIYVVMSSEYRQAYKNLLMCKSYGDEPERDLQLPQQPRSLSQRA